MDPANQTTELNPPKQKSFLSYTFAKPVINNITNSWSSKILTDILDRRKQRRWNPDRKKAVESKIINENTILVPIRVVDTNIAKEKPQYLQYLLQPERVATFVKSGAEDPSESPTRLEEIFTEAFQYDDWVDPLLRAVDCHSAHGWSSIEISLDITRPGHFFIDYIDIENLMFDSNVSDLEHSEMILRRYELTITAFRELVIEEGLPEKLAEKVVKDNAGSSERTSTKESHNDISGGQPIEIYKVFFKHEGIVYRAWYSKCLDKFWLKDPKPLYAGRDELSEEPTEDSNDLLDVGLSDSLDGPQPQQELIPIFETEYPIKLFPYTHSEESQITSIIGRIERDLPKQEASTAIFSGYTTGIVNSSILIGVQKNHPSMEISGNEPKQLKTKLVHGALYDREIEFTNMPPPPVDSLQALQAFDSMNAQETHQLAFMVKNRRDARKTKKEIESAEGDQQKIEFTTVLPFASAYSKVVNYCWRIFSNRVQNGKISWIEDEQDLQLFSMHWFVRPAGDFDVIKRATVLAQLQEDLAAFSSMPLLFMEMVKDYLKLRYPKLSRKYLAILEQNQQDQGQTIQQLLGILREALTPEELQALPPEVQQQLGSIMENANRSAQSNSTQAGV